MTEHKVLKQSWLSLYSKQESQACNAKLLNLIFVFLKKKKDKKKKRKLTKSGQNQLYFPFEPIILDTLDNPPTLFHSHKCTAFISVVVAVKCFLST